MTDLDNSEPLTMASCTPPTNIHFNGEQDVSKSGDEVFLCSRQNLCFCSVRHIDEGCIRGKICSTDCFGCIAEMPFFLTNSARNYASDAGDNHSTLTPAKVVFIAVNLQNPLIMSFLAAEVA